EKYLAAAETILDRAIVIADPPKLAKQTFDTIRTGSIGTAGELGKTVSVSAGESRVRCRVGGDQLGDEPVRVMLRVMGEDVKEFEVRATAAAPEVIEATLRGKAGTGGVGVVFLTPTASAADGRQRVLHLKGVEVEGPFD